MNCRTVYEMRLLITLLIALLCTASAPAAAEPYPDLREPPDVAPTGTDDVAVLVAIDDYLLLPDVRGARQNVRDWEAFLRDGLGVSDVRILVDAQATREDILAVLRSAAEAAPADARLWFVFVGHGAPTSDGSDGLLVGMDARGTPRSLDARGVPRSEILKIMEASAASPVVVLDACFSGSDTSGEPLAPGLQPILPAGTAPVVREGIVFSAAARDQFAGDLPGAGRPAFSYLLLGALRGWGDNDRDGNVSAGEAHDWVSRQLTAVTVREQTPELTGTSDTVVTWKAKERAPQISRAIARNLAGDDERLNENEPAASEASSGLSCADGKTADATTGEHCCWPGQAWNGDACVGKPSTCPAGHLASGEGCELATCEGGRVRAADGVHCCWEGQGYSRAEKRCVGKPTSCPDGTSPFLADASWGGDGCFETQNISIRTRAEKATVFMNGTEVGKTTSEGTLSVTLPRDEYFVSVEKDGQVIAQRKCPEGDCEVDWARRRWLGVYINPLGLLMPTAPLLSAKFGIKKVSLELSGDAGAVSEAYKTWFGGSVTGMFSTGYDAWTGAIFGLNVGYRRAWSRTEAGNSVPLVTAGPVIGLRHTYATGLSVEANGSMKLALDLDSNELSPVLDATLAVGWVF